MNVHDFKKADLRNGMVVELSNGDRYMVVGDKLLSPDKGSMLLSDFSLNMQNSFNAKYDICLVFDVRDSLTVYEYDIKPIWRRDNGLDLIEVKLTTSEALQEIMDIYEQRGYCLKIVLA